MRRGVGVRATVLVPVRHFPYPPGLVLFPSCAAECVTLKAGSPFTAPFFWIVVVYSHSGLFLLFFPHHLSLQTRSPHVSADSPNLEEAFAGF